MPRFGFPEISIKAVFVRGGVCWKGFSMRFFFFFFFFLMKKDQIVYPSTQTNKPTRQIPDLHRYFVTNKPIQQFCVRDFFFLSFFHFFFFFLFLICPDFVGPPRKEFIGITLLSNLGFYLRIWVYIQAVDIYIYMSMLVVSALKSIITVRV